MEGKRHRYLPINSLSLARTSCGGNYQLHGTGPLPQSPQSVQYSRHGRPRWCQRNDPPVLLVYISIPLYCPAKARGDMGLKVAAHKMSML